MRVSSWLTVPNPGTPLKLPNNPPNGIWIPSWAGPITLSPVEQRGSQTVDEQRMPRVLTLMAVAVAVLMLPDLSTS